MNFCAWCGWWGTYRHSGAAKSGSTPRASSTNQVFARPRSGYSSTVGPFPDSGLGHRHQVSTQEFSRLTRLPDKAGTYHQADAGFRARRRLREQSPLLGQVVLGAAVGSRSSVAFSYCSSMTRNSKDQHLSAAEDLGARASAGDGMSPRSAAHRRPLAEPRSTLRPAG